jgi:hypothetical protein
MIKNAKIPVDGLGGALEEFVVGNVLGDCSCGSVGGGAGGRPVFGSVFNVDAVVGVGAVDVDMNYNYYLYLLFIFYYMCLYLLCIICIN